MSAFMVSESHIAYLLEAATHPRILRGSSALRWRPFADPSLGTARELYPSGDRAMWEQAGSMLWAENWRSVCYRYPDTTSGRAPLFGWKPRRLPPVEPVQVLKACACFEYQACETPDWEESEAFRFIDSLRRHAIAALDGYEDAAWDIEDAERQRTAVR